MPPGQVRRGRVDGAAPGIPESKVYMFNGSRQSNNFTANAGGVGSTARVAISDVAFKNATLDEVRAVTGHEIGHYVLKHTWWGILFYSVAAIILFWIADRAFPRFAKAFGSSAQLPEARGIPVLIFMVGLFQLLTLPIFNTFSRTLESQADLYSLQTENRPDALSTSLVKTAEYRYPRPNRIQEIVFYDHPSVQARVQRATEWKVLGSFSASAAPCDAFLSNALGTSGDGRVVVGYARNGCTFSHAFRWEESTGMVDLGSSVAGQNSLALHVSADGKVVVGHQEQFGGFTQGARWLDGRQELFPGPDGFVGTAKLRTTMARSSAGSAPSASQPSDPNFQSAWCDAGRHAVLTCPLREFPVP